MRRKTKKAALDTLREELRQKVDEIAFLDREVKNVADRNAELNKDVRAAHERNDAYRARLKRGEDAEHAAMEGFALVDSLLQLAFEKEALVVARTMQGVMVERLRRRVAEDTSNGGRGVDERGRVNPEKEDPPRGLSAGQPVVHFVKPDQHVEGVVLGETGSAPGESPEWKGFVLRLTAPTWCQVGSTALWIPEGNVVTLPAPASGRLDVLRAAVSKKVAVRRLGIERASIGPHASWLYEVKVER